MTTIENPPNPHLEVAEDVGKVAVEADTPQLVESLQQESAVNETDKMMRQALSISIRRLHEGPDDPTRQREFTHDALRYINADPLEQSSPYNKRT